jgi:hypothetical protein
MCLSCGCGEPNEKHGDDRHITQDQINAAAQAAEITPMQAAQNIMNGMNMPQSGQQQDQQSMQM